MTRHAACQLTSHLVGESRRWQTNGSEAYGHGIGHQTDDGREHRLEAQSDEDCCRDSHGCTEACHTLEHTAETPCKQQHQQTFVTGQLGELRLDGLNLLGLAQNTVTKDGTDDD